MPKKETKPTNEDLAKALFNGSISWGLSDLYSGIECSEIEIFSLEPLKKVGTFKISK